MAGETTTDLQLARFRLGDGLFGIEIMKVREVLSSVAITKIPGAPEFVVGVVELRGDYIPVIDLRHRIGVPAQGGEHKIIIANARGRRVGLVVDQVFDVFRAARASVQPIDPLAHSSAYAGLVRADDGTVIVIDPDGLLSELEAGQLDRLPAVG